MDGMPVAELPRKTAQAISRTVQDTEASTTHEKYYFFKLQAWTCCCILVIFSSLDTCLRIIHLSATFQTSKSDDF